VSKIDRRLRENANPSQLYELYLLSSVQDKIEEQRSRNKDRGTNIIIMGGAIIGLMCSHHRPPSLSPRKLSLESINPNSSTPNAPRTLTSQKYAPAFSPLLPPPLYYYPKRIYETQ
jgi:hypothetical protein